MKILIGEQLTTLDQYTIEHEPIRPLDLMERAAEALTAKIISRWSASTPVYVFAGPGNNGGDGLAVARMLAERGYTVKAWLFNVSASLSLDCRQNYDRLLATERATVVEVRQGFEFPHITRGDLIIDALFGRGLNKALRGGFVSVVKSINQTRADVVSLDMPSGIATEDNTYANHDEAIHATLTLTIGTPKLALLMAENARNVGQWETVDIGLSQTWIDNALTPFTLTEPEDVTALMRPRPVFAHKGTFGYACLVSGSKGMAGAAILSAKACMRSGVGRLCVQTEECNIPLLQMTVPEAVVGQRANFTAIGVGPGMGRDEAAADLLRETIAYADAPMVVDADALNLLSTHKEWLAQLPAKSILTPHPAELERLVGLCDNDYDRLLRALDLAKAHGLIVVLKGHYTAICTHTGEVMFNQTGNAGMATAGSGDALTGLLTGLLAQGYKPTDAARLGVWLHGLAGDIAAQRYGQECMTASDLIKCLPKAYEMMKE